jgi:hypothetical protein
LLKAKTAIDVNATTVASRRSHSFDIRIENPILNVYQLNLGAIERVRARARGDKPSTVRVSDQRQYLTRGPK